MVRGRAGGTGAPFNLGEMTVTRCSLQLADGTVGHAYVPGRDRDHARRAAICDALMQGMRSSELRTRGDPAVGRRAPGKPCRDRGAGGRDPRRLLHHGAGRGLMQTESMQGGFANAPVDAALAFRAALEAMSRPGTVHGVAGASAPPPLSPAAAVLAMTLCDPETPVWLAPSVATEAVHDLAPLPYRSTGWLTRAGCPHSPSGAGRRCCRSRSFRIGTAEVSRIARPR